MIKKPLILRDFKIISLDAVFNNNFHDFQNYYL